IRPIPPQYHNCAKLRTHLNGLRKRRCRDCRRMYHILITPKVVTKAQNFLRALHYAAQQKALPVSVGPSYRDCKMLLMYGMGGADRLPIAKRHMQPGKTLVAFDLGYWERTLPVSQRKFRVAINGFHPKEVMHG